MNTPIAICNSNPHIRNLEMEINNRKDAFGKFAALNSGRLLARSHGASANSLTEEDLAVCRSMGISHEQFLATKNGTPSAALSGTHTPG